MIRAFVITVALAWLIHEGGLPTKIAVWGAILIVGGTYGGALWYDWLARRDRAREREALDRRTRHLYPVHDDNEEER